MREGAARDLVIRGGRCLLPGRGLVPADILCAAGRIAAIGPAGSARTGDIDATDCLVLPGIVDIHGDAFERQIMPRPGTMFPLAIALRDSDRQLVANGITTAYHGITFSWEPGLRSLEQSRRVVAALHALESHLQADNRIHLRWETFALEARSEMEALLTHRRTPLLAFNDHTSPLMQVADPRSAVARHAERSGITPDTYRALHAEALARQGEVPGAIRSLAALAARQGVPMLSHDDRTPAQRADYRAVGALIVEFPVTAEALDASVAAGDAVVMGAPNVVRGGSHTGALGAAAAIAAGKCTILASDYYYPAPLHAALALVAQGVLALEPAWNLVSAAPAGAAGLTDRGQIVEGRRADLVVLCPRDQRVIATLCAGRIAYRSS